ncbi:hypothetical protein CBR_g45786 [Chara braunii]|uniref:Uncharacterized protein n=1 Tax=Chara braunii TaxID=69332 RepID=A0A388LZF1_CHABU|nr:hypothetical protein CBR_g45786 [Chara braunii]|eukprot:GBG87633.1 hypothetical protein CBR_g45786 [Chara braunii]
MPPCLATNPNPLTVKCLPVPAPLKNPKDGSTRLPVPHMFGTKVADGRGHHATQQAILGSDLRKVGQSRRIQSNPNPESSTRMNELPPGIGQYARRKSRGGAGKPSQNVPLFTAQGLCHVEEKAPYHMTCSLHSTGMEEALPQEHRGPDLASVLVLLLLIFADYQISRTLDAAICAGITVVVSVGSFVGRVVPAVVVVVGVAVDGVDVAIIGKFPGVPAAADVAAICAEMAVIVVDDVAVVDDVRAILRDHDAAVICTGSAAVVVVDAGVGSVVVVVPVRIDVAHVDIVDRWMSPRSNLLELEDAAVHSALSSCHHRIDAIAVK